MSVRHDQLEAFLAVQLHLVNLAPVLDAVCGALDEFALPSTARDVSKEIVGVLDERCHQFVAIPLFLQ